MFRLNKERRYIQIWRLEFFLNKKPAWSNLPVAPCGCKIVEMGYFGLTWLSKECKP